MKRLIKYYLGIDGKDTSLDSGGSSSHMRVCMPTSLYYPFKSMQVGW